MNKKMLKKLLISLIIVVLISNTFGNNIVLAANENIFTVLGDWLNVAVGSVVGLLTYPFRILALGLSYGLDTLTASIAYSQGTVENGKFNFHGGSETITPFDIFFNKIALVDINFFNIPSEDSIVKNMRLAIAGWYYVMRNIAATILLCVLIYVGIRMAISTVASDKAAYKKMLVDWICSLALIFLFQYIMIFTFTVNEALINALKEVAGADSQEIINAMANIARTAKNLVTLDSIPATIVYCMLVGQTLSLLFTYFNRMLKIAFLVIISPLITLTYSMDKMGDGKAQALGTWLKEFIYTVIIQVFHCIIYTVFVGMAISILNAGVIESYNLVGSFLAVMCVKFTKDAEKILGKIFKFGESTSDSSLAVGAAASAALLANAGKIGKGTVKAVNGVRSLKNNMGDIMHKARVSNAALAAVWAAKKDGKELTYEQARDDAEAKVIDKEAAKEEKKNKRKYGVKSDSKTYNEKIDKAAEKLMNDNPNMSKNMARAKARAQIAAETKSAGKESKRPEIIKKARGAIQPWKEMAKEVRSSDVYKEISKGVQAYASGGLALFAGATMYGASGDAFKSLALGGTAFKGSQEALKNSSTTMVDDANSLLDGLGAKNKDDVAREMQTTHEMAPILSDNNELDKYLDDLLKFVDTELAKAGKDPEGKDAKIIKSNIKNTVAQQVKKNPTISPQDMQNAVLNNLQKSDASKANVDTIANSGGFGEAIDNVATARRRKDLYDVMQNANDLNLTPETFTKMVQKRYGNSSSSDFKTNEEIVQRTSEENYKITDADIDERTEKAREELREELLEEFKTSQHEMDYDNMSASEVNAEIEVQKAMIENVQALNDRELAETVTRCKANYEELAEKLKNDLTQEARTEILNQIKELNKEMQSNIDKFRGEYELSAQKNGASGARISYVSDGDDNMGMVKANKLVTMMDRRIAFMERNGN